jgi:hypothetical protein
MSCQYCLYINISLLLFSAQYIGTFRHEINRTRYHTHYEQLCPEDSLVGFTAVIILFYDNDRNGVM